MIVAAVTHFVAIAGWVISAAPPANVKGGW